MPSAECLVIGSLLSFCHHTALYFVTDWFWVRFRVVPWKRKVNNVLTLRRYFFFSGSLFHLKESLKSVHGLQNFLPDLSFAIFLISPSHAFPFVHFPQLWLVSLLFLWESGPFLFQMVCIGYSLYLKTTLSRCLHDSLPLCLPVFISLRLALRTVVKM